MAPYDYIQTDAQLAELTARLRAAGCRRLAIDVEGENNLHSYGIHVALIQLFDGSRGAVVDALAIRDRALLAGLLVNAPWTLVWFDAANDLLSFQHALGLKPSPILDISIAARLLGKPGGLRELTRQGGSASAKDRFQRSNWLRRPLSRALLDYAFSDVLHLLPLADELMAEITSRGLADEMATRNLEAQDAVRTWAPFGNYTRIPGFTRMRGPDRQFARVLWCARELYGQEHDMPPGNVASKQDMKTIVDRELRTAGPIAAFLNEHRQRNRVVSSDLERCFIEAGKRIPQA